MLISGNAKGYIMIVTARKIKLFALFILLFQMTIVSGICYAGYKIYSLDWSHGLKGALTQVWEGSDAGQK